MPKGYFNDLSGRSFGRLKVKERSPSRDTDCHSVYWTCECSCGGTKRVAAQSLSAGKVASCGCLRDEMSKMRLAVRREAGERPELRQVSRAVVKPSGEIEVQLQAPQTAEFWWKTDQTYAALVPCLSCSRTFRSWHHKLNRLCQRCKDTS